MALQKLMALAALAGALLLLPSRAGAAGELKIGMIGLDTSHVVEFTRILNDPKSPNYLPGGRVVAAYKGGSPDMPDSINRVEGFTQELTGKYGVELVDSIDALCAKVDVVLLESVDGRRHLEQVTPVFKAGKPVFIDKPVAASLRDARRIYNLAAQYGVPCFSASSYRFYDSMAELKKKDAGKLRAAVSYGPAPRQATHPDLFYYGIHATEALFTVLGTGCQKVTRSEGKDCDVVTGIWSDGRVGTLVGLQKTPSPHKVIVFGDKAVAEQAQGTDGYRPLLVEIMKFFQTRVAPVSPKETLEIFAFMEAAEESKRQGGAPVTIEEVMKQ